MLMCKFKMADVVREITFRALFLSLCFYLSLLLDVCPLPARAQLTVGNASKFLFREGKSNDFGIQGSDIGKTQFGEDLFTRHEREGNTLGIGSSTLQTTNVTSESGASVIAPFSVTSTEKSAPRPSTNLNSAIQGFSSLSPALSGSTVSPTQNTFHDVSTMSSYSQSGNPTLYQPTSVYQDLNTLPSFSRVAPHINMPGEGLSDYDSMLARPRGGF